jgi:DNA-directed RNA polymerase subunit N (RpoN/RPB10)
MCCPITAFSSGVMVARKSGRFVRRVERNSKGGIPIDDWEGVAYNFTSERKALSYWIRISFL